MHSLHTTIRTNIKIVVLGTILALSVSLVSAQTFNAAPADPPNSNTPEPLNVGPTEQRKLGPLVVNEALSLPAYSATASNDGLWVAGRSNLLGDVLVGIAGASTYNLAVTGDVSIGRNLTLTTGNMDIKGTIKIQGGCTPSSPCLGKVLVSDSQGLASWQTPPSLNIPPPPSGGGSCVIPDPYPLIWCRVAPGQSSCQVSCRAGDQINSGGTAVLNREAGQCSNATGNGTGTLNCQGVIGSTNCVCAAMCDG